MPTIKAIARFSRRREVILPAGFALGIFFAILTVRDIDWGKLGEEFGRVSVTASLASLVLIQVSAFLRAVRWRLTWVTHRVSTLRLFMVENASLGLNNVSPVRLLDEPAIVTMLTLRDGYPASVVMASVLMTRVQDLTFTLAFIAAAVAAVPELSAHAGPVALTSIPFLGFLVALLTLPWLANRFPQLTRKLGVGSFGAAVQALLDRKRRLALTFSLTATYWLALGPAALVLARAMDIEITLLQATIVTLGSIFFATTVPGLPGAVGTFELAAVEILGLWDVPREAGLSFAIILHLLLFAPPTLIAAVVLPREGVGFAFLGRRRPQDAIAAERSRPP